MEKCIRQLVFENGSNRFKMKNEASFFELTLAKCLSVAKILGLLFDMQPGVIHVLQNDKLPKKVVASGSIKRRPLTSSIQLSILKFFLCITVPHGTTTGAKCNLIFGTSSRNSSQY